jgi:hypothetical protein
MPERKLLLCQPFLFRTGSHIGQGAIAGSLICLSSVLSPSRYKINFVGVRRQQ